MAFEFKKRESARTAIRRMGRRQIGHALGALRDCDRLDAVHEARRRVKKTRALLRFVRKGVAPAKYQTLMADLREASGKLAPARDAYVKRRTIDTLSAQFRTELAPNAFREATRLLSMDCRIQLARLVHDGADRAAGRQMKRALKDVRSLKLKRGGWSALAPGLKRSYRRGRDCYRAALDEGTPEQFHQWRKRVKDLMYQISILCPIWPEQMAAAESELGKLADRLGDDHDLQMLLEPGWMARLQGEAPDEARRMQVLAEQRQRELRIQALAIGARFYEEKPAIFCRRIAGYWKRWRHEPKRATPRR